MLRKFNLIVILIICLNLIFASGWHIADEIYGGNFTENYDFKNMPTVNHKEIQLRVDSSCSVGSSIRVINEDGSVVCENSLVGITENFANSTYVNENQVESITSDMIIDNTIHDVDVDNSSIQLRINSSCSVGSSIRVINEDGSVVCETDSNSGGTLGGTGTTNYISKFTNANTLSNSVIYETGGNIGIGTSSPITKLDVEGNTLVNYLGVGNSVVFSSNYLSNIDHIFSDDLNHLGQRIDLRSNFNLSADRSDYATYNYVQADDVIEGSFNYDIYGTYSRAFISAGSTARNVRGIYGYAQSASTSLVDSLRGIDSFVINDANGTVGISYGTQATVINDEGTTNYAFGGSFAVQQYGTGNIPFAYGVYSNILETEGSINNAYGFRSNCNDATTCYGLYVDAGDPEVINDWGIYVAGEDNNYFSGNVGIGTTTPEVELDVNGKIRMRTQTSGSDADDIVATKGYVDSLSTASTGIVSIDDNSICQVSNQGTIKYNTTSKKFYGCDSTDWKEISLGNIEGGNDLYTVLLLHCEALIDSSANSHIISSVGNAAISSVQSKFGSSSCYFDGNGDYLSIPDSTDWDFKNGDFTIDFWAYPTGGSGNMNLLDYGGNGGWNIWYSVSYVSLYTSAVGYNTASTTLTTGVWNHVAIVREGNTFTVYINGVNRGGWVSSASFANPSSVLKIGLGTYGTYMGYMDEIRISKGIPRWTKSFTPENVAYY